jgi:protein-disulfide isomerase/uncharacterized membrane protein
MNKKLNLLLISLFATTLTFLYLTYHHYSLILGITPSSLCHISQTLNCDAAALSSYSEFLGIPIAVLGMSFSFVLFVITLFIRLEWLEPTAFITLTLKILLSTALAISLTLGAISVFKLGVVCPFCLLSYLLIFINTGLIFNIYKFDLSIEPILQISEHKGYLLALLMVPFLAWFTSSTILSSFGYDELLKVIPEKLAYWKQMPVQKFDLNAGLIKGDITSENTLVEFADFKCPHCKVASETIKNFSKSSPKLKIVFKPFPLDGNCNPNVSFKGDSSRCQMAGIALCSEKISQKGWAVHDYFFENQENLSQVTDIKENFKKFAETLKLNADDILKCSDSAETYALIAQLSNEGKAAHVEGTPTIYLNNQKIEGQFLPILKAAYKTLN